MLMNYSDALARGVGAAKDDRFHAVLQNEAAVRLMNSTQDFNQRALSCPILTR